MPHSLGREAVRLDGVRRMGADIKSLAISVLRRHGLVSSQSQPDGTDETPVRPVVLTLKDLPELELRLKLAGWQVERRGDELHCKSRNTRVQ